MKKSILTSTLIAAVALAAPAFADDGLLPELANQTWLGTGPSNMPSGWSSDIGHPSNISADVVSSCFGTGNFTDSGWYVGDGNWNDGGTYATDFSFTNDGFTFLGRSGLNGEYVAAVVNLSDILGDGEELSSFSLSFEYSGSNVGFSVYCIDLTADADNVTQLYSITESGSISYEWTAYSEDYYLTGDYALMFIWNSDSAAASVTVSDLSSSYVTTPEPSMFGLFFGLGAIGLVATRRRRR